MTFEIIQSIVEDEYQKLAVRPGETNADLAVRAITACMVRCTVEAQREIREQVLEMGSRAQQMASTREMAGYADACKEIVEEIDRLKLPVDLRGRPLKQLPHL